MNRRFWYIALIGLLAAGSAHADDVEIRSSFPSPYGNYNQMEAVGQGGVPGAIQLGSRGGNINMATGGNARVAIGVANPEGGAERVLGVRGAGMSIGNFRANNGFGVTVGSSGGDGSIQAVDAGGAATLLSLNPGGGFVGINTVPAYTLHVNGTVAMDDGTGADPIQYVYDGGGNFGHAYAP